MDRMKTFFLYFLGIVGFMMLSYILEDGLIENMYVKMQGDVLATQNGIYIDEVSGKASNVNGFMQFRVSNSSENNNKEYIKLDLYSKQGLLASTKYIEITDLNPGSTKTYQVKFKGTEIRTYNISVIDESMLPDKTNIINVLGWEIDLSNVFGLGIDLTNMSLFGVKLTDLFNASNIKAAGGNAWTWIVNFLNSIPWWGYAIGAGIILWYMPKGYLFGIFPF
jgi:hypothetical protein